MTRSLVCFSVWGRGVINTWASVICKILRLVGNGGGFIVWLWEVGVIGWRAYLVGVTQAE